MHKWQQLRYLLRAMYSIRWFYSCEILWVFRWLLAVTSCYHWQRKVAPAGYVYSSSTVTWPFLSNNTICKMSITASTGKSHIVSCDLFRESEWAEMCRRHLKTHFFKNAFCLLTFLPHAKHRGDILVVSVCMSVCMLVCMCVCNTITFDSLEAERSFSICWYIFWRYRSLWRNFRSVVRVRCRHKKFTFAISSSDKFLV